MTKELPIIELFILKTLQLNTYICSTHQMEHQTPVIYTESDVIIVPRKKKDISPPDVIIVPHKKKGMPVVKPVPVVESVSKVIKKNK
jgi:hypothetical protein